jgi:putative heme iron utilization protein
MPSTPPPMPLGPTSAEGLFHELRALGPLRVISVAGPSTFEAILQLGPFGVAEGWLNSMTPDYHWHLDLDRCSGFRTRDAVHERSGRRVLYFELLEGEAPFLAIYLHREKGTEFTPERLARFLTLHSAAEAGVDFVRVAS